MVGVPNTNSRKTAKGRLIAKLTADIEHLSRIPARSREAELADVREQDARAILEAVKSGNALPPPR